jgi:DNA adenine methylase
MVYGMTKEKIAKPFIKWAGGKKRVINHILEKVPANVSTYHEPFLGGGAVFFALKNLHKFKKAVLNDTNTHVVVAYQLIQSCPHDLIHELEKPEYRYDKDSYLEIRRQFNDNLAYVQADHQFTTTAQFIYLNRTCFNGLFRVNKQGKFNTPFGKYLNPVICDRDNILAVSKALRGKVKITNVDFEQAVKNAKQGDFVYFDPPYLPLSKTANFTKYDATGFTESDHWRLRGVFSNLASKGVDVLLSNSSSPLSYNMYGQFNIEELEGPRTIGGPTKTRDSVKELLISAR